MHVNICAGLDPDTLLSLPQVARLLPHPPHPSTLWRWRTIGANGAKLQMIRIGHSWYVRCRDLNDFIAAQTEFTNTPREDRRRRATEDSKRTGPPAASD